MIEGYFKPLDHVSPPAPYVRAAILLKGANHARFVDFLVDTGADSTCIHPRDVLALGVDSSIFDRRQVNRARGIGGCLNYIAHDAVLIFGESGNQTLWQSKIDVFDVWENPQDEEITNWLPSLLGRDFLNLCDIHLNPTRNIFTLDPILQPGLLSWPPSP